ncbi:MAG: hypothetical protein RLZZ571_71 [Actinomycetota bacterium]|jgi:hypothetical protein
MRAIRTIALLLLGISLVACGKGSKSESSNCVSTNTGYQMCVTPDLFQQLSSEEMKAEDGIFQADVFSYGAISATTIYYTDLTAKDKHILLTVFLFPEDKFDAAANPYEPPMFGQEVIRESGNVLSVAGPQDSMFDPESQDGKNITALYEAMHKAQTWVK